MGDRFQQQSAGALIDLTQPNWVLEVFDSSAFKKAVAAENTSVRHLHRGILTLYDVHLYCNWGHQCSFYPVTKIST